MKALCWLQSAVTKSDMVHAISHLFVSIKCNGHPIFHRRVWYHTISLHYVCIRSSGIILINYDTFVPNFVSFVTPIACLLYTSPSPRD